VQREGADRDSLVVSLGPPYHNVTGNVIEHQDTTSLMPKSTLPLPEGSRHRRRDRHLASWATGKKWEAFLRLAKSETGQM